MNNAQLSLDAVCDECLVQFSRVICTPERGYKNSELSWLMLDIRRVAEIAAGMRKPDFGLPVNAGDAP